MGILLYLFFLSTIFLTNCSIDRRPVSSEFCEIAKEDWPWIKEFFDDFFLNKITLYTLFGAKPMSEIPVCCASKEQWLSNYVKWIDEKCPKEEREQAIIEFKEYLDCYDLPRNWEKWVCWKAEHLDSPFLFSKRPTSSENIFSLHILNIQEAAWILHKHYSVISHELDMEFDPLQVVMEFEDLDSAFWKKVFGSHYVQGILHGFGERNAYFFSRTMHLQNDHPFNLHSHPLFGSALSGMCDGGDLPVPQFRSFFEDTQLDPSHQHYLREKRRISKLLRGKDPYTLILNRLGYQINPEPKEIVFELSCTPPSAGPGVLDPNLAVFQPKSQSLRQYLVNIALNLSNSDQNSDKSEMKCLGCRRWDLAFLTSW